MFELRASERSDRPGQLQRLWRFSTVTDGLNGVRLLPGAARALALVKHRTRRRPPSNQAHRFIELPSPSAVMLMQTCLLSDRRPRLRLEFAAPA